MKIKLAGFFLIVSLLLPGWAAAETRVAGTTVPAGAQIISSALLDHFDDGANPNLWGGDLTTFADGGATVLAGYSASNALGGSGQLLQLTYDVTAPNSFSGCSFNLAEGGAPRDISEYKYLSFYVRSGASVLPRAFKVELVNVSTDPAHNKSVLYLNDYLDGAPGAVLTEVRIPLSAFANLNSLANVRQINFVFENGYASSSNFSQSGTVDIDQIGFGSGTPPPVRIDAFGDNAGLNALGGNVGHFWGGDSAAHTFSFNPSEFHTAARGLESNYTVTDGFAGIYFLFGGGLDGNSAYPHNFASRNALTLWVKAQNFTAHPDRIKIELAGGSGAVFAVTLPDGIGGPAFGNTWQKYTIPLTSFLGLDKGSIRQMNIVYDTGLAGAGNGVGKLYFDEIQFE